MVFEVALRKFGDSNYAVDIKGDLPTFVKIHEVLHRIIEEDGRSRATYGTFLIKLANAISSGTPVFSMSLDEFVHTLNMNDWGPVSYYAPMFGMNPKELSRSRQNMSLRDFLYRYPTIGVENIRVFNRFMTFNILFWLGESPVSDIVEPITFGTITDNSVIVNKDGVFKVMLKKVPTSSTTVTSAVNSYTTALEQQAKQYRVFLDEMAKDMKKEVERQFEMATQQYLGKIKKMYVEGYKFINDSNGMFWFYKDVKILPETLLYNGKVYEWRPLQSNMQKFVQEYKDWIVKGAPTLPSSEFRKYTLFTDIYKYYGSNWQLIQNYSNPYVQGIYIEPEIILKKDLQLRIRTGAGLHSNVSTGSDGHIIGFGVCLGNLEKIVPAMAAVPMIEDTLKMMNHDSALNSDIGGLAMKINDVYRNTEKSSSNASEPKDFMDMATFHTI